MTLVLGFGLTVESAQPRGVPQEYRLAHGLKVILLPQREHSVAVVALGLRAGVYDEPEGRSGLAHLAEHLFWYGQSKSYPAYRAFEALSRGGPLGQPYQDANAETLWDLTYFYAARPAGGVDLALDIFAEKLRGVEVGDDVLRGEREKVIAEITHATENLKKFPGLVRTLPRYPKAGVEAHVRNLEASHVASFLATHYRPDRAILLVQGDFEVEAVRRRVKEKFETITPQAPRPVREGEVAGEPRQSAVEFDCAAATPRERAALSVLGALWEEDLRRGSSAYTEVSGGGRMRAALIKLDQAALVASWEARLQPLSAEDLRKGIRLAGERLKLLKWQLEMKPPTDDKKRFLQFMMQSGIWRLQFEAGGGQERLNDLQNLSAAEVTAVAKKYLRTPAVPPRLLP
jgi:hypothetical protein